MSVCKKFLLVANILVLLYACKPEHQQPPTPPDLNTFAGSYLVSGTHYNWHYSGPQPIDSVVQQTYTVVGDTLAFSKVNDTTIHVALSDTGTVLGTSMTYKGRTSTTGGYIFLWGFNGGPDYDSLVIYTAVPNSVYFSFSTNYPHTGGDTYQMLGPKIR